MQIDFALEARAQRHDAGGGDLSGLPDPVPADHDDHDGGAARRGADRARLRRRRRSAAAARPGGGRRADVLAAGDAVPDAGVYTYMAQFQTWLGRRATVAERLPVAQ